MHHETEACWGEPKPVDVKSSRWRVSGVWVILINLGSAWGYSGTGKKNCLKNGQIKWTKWPRKRRRWEEMQSKPEILSVCWKVEWTVWTLHGWVEEKRIGWHIDHQLSTWRRTLIYNNCSGEPTPLTELIIPLLSLYAANIFHLINTLLKIHI